ncbi:FHA domain-containing protein, partial [Mycobacterium simiae]
MPLQWVPMTQTAAPPVLTVRYNGAERTFAAGHDVVIGRDLRADVRVADPLISRVHLLVRFDQGRWVAIDNGSLNGLYIDNRRVPVVDIQDGQRVNIGNPDGPALDFGVGRRQQGSVGRPPATTAMPVPPMPSAAWPVQGPPQTGTHRPGQPQQPPPTTRMPGQPPSGPQHLPPSAPPPQFPTGVQPMRPHSGPQPAPQIYRPPTAVPPPPLVARPSGETGNIATSMMKILRPGKAAGELPPGSIRIGRADDNDVVIPEVLASRHHATLIPTPSGTEIRDNRSINGTFVNGVRVESALLRDGDVITIGNIDLVFAEGVLTRREESLLETRTGGLDVGGVTWTIEGNKTLL